MIHKKWKKDYLTGSEFFKTPFVKTLSPMLTKIRPLALYLHIPYCLEKCPYCDFHSIAVSSSEIPYQDYADCLMAQMKQEVARLALQNRELVSIFFGGGTPSLMTPHFFRQVLSAAASHFNFKSDIEITVESNPATVCAKNFKEWLAIGINRVSFGVQSFQNPLLKKLGRNHSAAQAKEGLQMSLDAGFENVSCDLIFGMEGESLKELEEDLRQAISFNLPHMSAYQLTVESGTPLASSVKQGLYRLPEEDILVAMHEKVSQTFESHGWHRYEVSNYAKPGFQSRHNLQYWRYEEYLGIGSGAVSSVANKRWRTTRKLKDYLNKQWNFEEEETLDAKTALKEKWMMGLRLQEGLPLKMGDRRWERAFLKMEEEGLLRQSDEKIQVTQKGFLVLNRITQNVFDLIDQMC